MPIEAWHFLKAPNTLRDGSTFEVGQWLPEIADPVLCVRGYHGSRRAIDALYYAPGTIVCWCEYGGQVSISAQCDDKGYILGSDKFVASRRRAIWQYDATSVLLEFARSCGANTTDWCTEQVYIDQLSLMTFVEAKNACARTYRYGVPAAVNEAARLAETESQNARLEAMLNAGRAA